MPSDLLSTSKYLQPKSQIHKNDYLGLLTSSEIFHSAITGGTGDWTRNSIKHYNITA